MINSKVQPARDFFELFSFQSKYDIDIAELKTRYRELQLKFHPDQYSADASGEKMAAVKMSSLLNDAFEVLSNPVKRAQYLLERAGVDLQKDRHIENSILMEQMELRECFEEISHISDENDKEKKLESLQAELEAKFKDCELRFSKMACGDLKDIQVLQGLKQILTKMLFLNKLISELVRSLEVLD